MTFLKVKLTNYRLQLQVLSIVCSVYNKNILKRLLLWATHHFLLLRRPQEVEWAAAAAPLRGALLSKCETLVMRTQRPHFKLHTEHVIKKKKKRFLMMWSRNDQAVAAAHLVLDSLLERSASETGVVVFLLLLNVSCSHLKSKEPAQFMSRRYLASAHPLIV